MFLGLFLGHPQGIVGEDHCSSGQNSTFFSAITNVHYFLFFMESYSSQQKESILHFFGFLATFLGVRPKNLGSEGHNYFYKESACANVKHRV